MNYCTPLPCPNNLLDQRCSCRTISRVTKNTTAVVVSALALYSDNPSLNPAEAYMVSFKLLLQDIIYHGKVPSYFNKGS